jgi:hypothetical protein
MDQILFGPQVAFRRLDRSMSQKQLDLLKLTATGPAQLRARASLMPHAA